MKISAQEEYGLRCLLQLARAETMGETLTLSQLAQLEGISSANAGKLMWILSKAGLVQSTRGIKGGYALARPASHTGDCGIRPVIIELHQIVDNALADITLSQLLGTEANVDAALHQIQGVKPNNRV
jgi:Rrf2 family iron-sulfur cluster assembly transcriptional regulator